MNDGKCLVHKVVGVTESTRFSFTHTLVFKGYVIRGIWLEEWCEAGVWIHCPCTQSTAPQGSDHHPGMCRLGRSTSLGSAHKIDLPSANSNSPNTSVLVVGYILFALFHTWINLLNIYCLTISNACQRKSSPSLKNAWEA